MYQPRKDPKLSLYSMTLAHVIRLFTGAFLFLPANIAVLQIRQHLRQMRGKESRGTLSGLVIRAVFKGRDSCVLDPASVND